MNQDPLNLRNLNRLEPSSELWKAIRGELDSHARPQGRRKFVAPALAAGIAAAMVLGLLLGGVFDSPAPQLLPANEAHTAMAESAGLEAELRHWQQRAVDAQTLHELLLLEAELGWLDLRLNERPDDVALWRQRGDLLTEMILRYAEPVELAAWTPTPI